LLGDHYVSLNGYFFGRGLYKRIFIFIISETRLSSALCFSTIEGENYIYECLFIEKKGATRVIKYKVQSSVLPLKLYPRRKSPNLGRRA
jgi:hypothetical protein